MRYKKNSKAPLFLCIYSNEKQDFTSTYGYFAFMQLLNKCVVHCNRHSRIGGICLCYVEVKLWSCKAYI